MSSLGSRIKHRRKELGLTQAEVGRHVGVTHVTISQWENEISTPSGMNLYHLGKSLNASLEWILCGELYPVVPVVSDEEKMLLVNYRKNPKKRQESIQDVARLGAVHADDKADTVSFVRNRVE